MIIFLCCLLTVIIETCFLAALGFRKPYEIKIIVCANIATNLTLNLALAVIPSLYGWIYVSEALVVAAEYFIYRQAFGGLRRLFGLTLAANMLSYCLGLLIF